MTPEHLLATAENPWSDTKPHLTRLTTGPSILSSRHGTNTRAGTFTSSAPDASAAPPGSNTAWNYWPKAQAPTPPSLQQLLLLLLAPGGI